MLPADDRGVRGRAEPLGIDVRVVAPAEMQLRAAPVFGAIVQSPDAYGALLDLAPLIARAHDAGAGVAVGADLLALTLVTPPGELGADVVYRQLPALRRAARVRRAARGASSPPARPSCGTCPGG